ncbi:hypothetical protein C8F04DRAFT_1274845 [Mycena alexandri]|uniref:Uncharacterized protein n=1 Tax=Mycena alexandri TaxID=1745969 RepID=A0AAD6S525_9AGAR|nr:hypothetical protein C8F04DRAFT_1274845 [Mycena alexandri]
MHHFKEWQLYSSKHLQLGAFIEGGPLPRLREIEMQVGYDDEEYEEGIIPSLNVFRDAPVLQHVVVNKSYGGSRFQRSYLGPNCRRIAKATHGVGTFLHSVAPAISSSARWKYHATDINDSVTAPPSSLPLRKPAFLEYLEAPALLELYCDYALPLLPFLRRQMCKLTKLVAWEGSTLIEV